jgi:hypothetical protein
MKVAVGFPPNIKEIRRALNPHGDTVFTYGDTLFIPRLGTISTDLFAHEMTHTRQQGKNPKAWWKKYLSDAQFRLSQEAEAYHNQYKLFVEQHKDRNICAKFLLLIATALSGRMYGNMVNISDAMKLIKEGAQ